MPHLQRLLGSGAAIQVQREIGDYDFLVGDPINSQRDLAAQMPPEAREWIGEFLRDRFDIDRLVSPAR